MARPRVFICSTFYDLKHIRSDLERFVTGFGYEPVLSERGQIPYGSTEKLEEFCYKEIANCDMLVAIIGGNFGSPSSNSTYSVSQREIMKAHELGKQIYIFIDENVRTEHDVYLKNKEKAGIIYHFANDVKVHEFIAELLKLPLNNATTTFRAAAEIEDFLREQWAGLFQRYLQDQTRLREVELIKGLQDTASTLDKMVTYLRREPKGDEAALKALLDINHPAYARLKALVGVPYRVIFTNYEELCSWLGARSFVRSEDEDGGETEVWINKSGDTISQLKISREIFDEHDKLRPMSAADWNSDWIKLSMSVKKRLPPAVVSQDDIPF